MKVAKWETEESNTAGKIVREPLSNGVGGEKLNCNVLYLGIPATQKTGSDHPMGKSKNKRESESWLCGKANQPEFK